jgi:hypothetical protein
MYFVATTIVTDGPTSDRMRSYRSRSSSGDTREDSLDAAGLAVAAVGEEELRMARRAEVDAFDLRDACVEQSAFGRAPQIEPAVADDLAPEARAERAGDVVAHLVATGTDPRADRSCELAVAEGGDGALDDASQ